MLQDPDLLIGGEWAGVFIHQDDPIPILLRQHLGCVQIRTSSTVSAICLSGQSRRASVGLVSRRLSFFSREEDQEVYRGVIKRIRVR